MVHLLSNFCNSKLISSNCALSSFCSSKLILSNCTLCPPVKPAEGPRIHGLLPFYTSGDRLNVIIIIIVITIILITTPVNSHNHHYLIGIVECCLQDFFPTNLIIYKTKVFLKARQRRKFLYFRSHLEFSIPWGFANLVRLYHTIQYAEGHCEWAGARAKYKNHFKFEKI